MGPTSSSSAETLVFCRNSRLPSKQSSSVEIVVFYQSIRLPPKQLSSAETVVDYRNSPVPPKTVVFYCTKHPPGVSRQDGAARDSLPRPCQHLQQRHHQHSQGERDNFKISFDIIIVTFCCISEYKFFGAICLRI